MRKLTDEQMQKALTAVAEFLGPKMGHDGPAPTGEDAAYRAEGPMLHPAWTWPDTPTPTILLEGGPDDWAVKASMDALVMAKMRQAGVFAEPYAGYALCLYPA